MHQETTMYTNIRTSITPAFGILAAVCTVLALGQPATAVAAGVTGRDVTIQYSELAINTTQGAEQLLNRIRAAAASVCAPLNHGDIASRARRDACQDKLVAAGVAKVNRPQLFAVYDRERSMAPQLPGLAKAAVTKQQR
jgi:UrcA family protein